MNRIIPFKIIRYLSLVLVVFLSGCWSSVELNNRAISGMIMVDTSPKGIELTLGFVLPNRMIPGQAGGSGDNSGPPYSFVTKEAPNIGTAYRLIQNDISRRIALGQIHVIIIGKSLAEQGISPILEFLTRQPNFHVNSNVFIAPGRALEIAKTPTIFERFLSTILIAYVQEHAVSDTMVSDFLISNYFGGDRLAPILSMEESTQGSSGGETGVWMGTDGNAIFKNLKMTPVRLTREEAQGALWLTATSVFSIFTIESPLDAKDVTFVIEGKKGTVKTRLKQGKPTFDISTKGNAYVLSSESDTDFLDPKALEKLQNELNAEIQDKIKRTIDKSIKANSDVYGFAQYLDAKYPRYWRDNKAKWREIYSNGITYTVKSKVSIIQTGGSHESISGIKRKVITK